MNDEQQPHLQITSSQKDFTRAQLSVLSQAGAQDLSPSDRIAFLHICQRTKLDPFSRQIYAITRGGRMTVQTAIDGYRLIAHRTGSFVGVSESWEMTPDGHGVVSATVVVKRVVQGVVCDFSATAHLCEYGGSSQIWRRMPRRMLAKCAEANALRRAFPAELAGVYAKEEMDQADAHSEQIRVCQPVVIEDAATADAVEVLDAEIVEDDALTREKALELIDSSESLEALQSLAGRFVGELGEADRAALRPAYNAKKAALADAF